MVHWVKALRRQDNSDASITFGWTFFIRNSYTLSSISNGSSPSLHWPHLFSTVRDGGFPRRWWNQWNNWGKSLSGRASRLERVWWCIHCSALAIIKQYSRVWKGHCSQRGLCIDLNFSFYWPLQLGPSRCCRFVWQVADGKLEALHWERMCVLFHLKKFLFFFVGNGFICFWWV